MKTLGISILFFATACFGQQWEFGGSAGGSFLPMLPVSSPAGSASAGFQPGFAAGAFVGQRYNEHISGEVRYTFFDNAMKLSSGSQNVTFSSNAHAIYYDLLLTTRQHESRAQFFAAIGGGMKIFRGTGAEQAYQPLYQFAFLTKTQKVEPMASIGGGVKFRLTPHLAMRAEIRDFLTPFPKALITPAPGAKIGSFLNDFVPMVSISYEQ
jgi:Outer membrane protein beta-barrel domain